MKIEYYCSSPKCKNECGKKIDQKKFNEERWKNPVACELTIVCYEPFCDQEGNLRFEQI